MGGGGWKWKNGPGKQHYRRQVSYSQTRALKIIKSELQPEEFNVPHSSSATSQIGQLQLCNEDTPFAVMCVSWLLSMTPQAASTCFRWLTSVAATRDLSQRRYSGNSSSFVDSTSLLPVVSLIAVTSRTRQRTTRPHCKVEVWNFFNFLGHVELFRRFGCSCYRMTRV